MVTKFPALLDNSGGTPFTLPDSIEVGPAMYTSAAQVVHGMFIDNAPGAVAGCAASIYKDSASGVPVARKAFDMVVGDNMITFDAPVTLDANATYYTEIHMPDISYRVLADVGLLGPPAYSEGTFSIGLFGDDGNPTSFYTTPASAPATPPVTRFGHTGENVNWHGIGVWWDDEAEPVPLTLTSNSPRNIALGATAVMAVTPHDGNGTPTYSWAKVSGPSSPAITGGTTPSASVAPTVVGAYVYRCTADDGTTQVTIDVTVNVSPTSNFTVTTTSPVSVDVGGTASLVATPHDAEGPVTYAWTQTSGATLTIADDDQATASVAPTAAGTYVFEVEASDGIATDTASVTVTASVVVPSADSIYIKVGGVTYGPFGPSVPAQPPHVFRPEQFGAVGDMYVSENPTDDTAAWAECVETAIAAAPDNNNYVEIQMAAKAYRVASPSIPGLHYGNSQIPIPYVQGSAGEKITLCIKGVGDNSPFVYWAQTTPHRSGSMLVADWNPAGPPSGHGFGTPSVIGGPTNLDSVVPQDAMKTLSSMVLVLDGVLVQIPRDYYIGAFNASRMAQLVVKSAGAISDRNYGSDPMMSQLPTHDYAYGLYCPVTGNNARTQIDCFTAQGLGVALYGAEHIAADYIGAVYCRKGVVLTATGNDYTWPDGSQNARAHSVWIGRLLCEGVKKWVVNDGYDGQLIINSFDGEGSVAMLGTNFETHIDDPESKFVGEVHFGEIFSQTPVVNGAERLRIVSDQQVRGARTAPAVPASDEVFLNPFWRDADVYITGGAVSAIKVDGMTLGITSGHVSVPTGKKIAITYSVAPSWKWVLH